MRTRSVRCWLNRLEGRRGALAVRLLLALFLTIGQPLGAIAEAAHSRSGGMSAVAASPVANPFVRTAGDLDAGHGSLSHANGCHYRGACTVPAILPRPDLAPSVRTSEDTVFADRAVQGHRREPNTPPPIA